MGRIPMSDNAGSSRLQGSQVLRPPWTKRCFDLAFCVLALPLWLPLTLGGLLAIALGSGLPVLYISPRLVYRQQVARVAKMRTMVRNAAEIANRQTVPIEGKRFLNISSDSPLYTRVGRVIERLCLTELPQFVHVLSGKMSVIGNRPLPVDVLESLTEAYPDAPDRFLSRAGLTGPAQLVGRDRLSDGERLAIEIAYCEHCLHRYRMYLDLMIALRTGLVLAGLSEPLSAQEVSERMRRWARSDGGAFAGGARVDSGNEHVQADHPSRAEPMQRTAPRSAPASAGAYALETRTTKRDSI